MAALPTKRYSLPQDGFIHLVPKGEFPHSASGYVQVLDDKAIQSMANSFKTEIPLGIDHYDDLTNDEKTKLAEMGISLPSNAAGWIQQVQVRPDGLWGKPVFTEKGAELVNSGEYRLLSPVFPMRTCEMVDESTKRIRPMTLKSASFTNEPNLKAIAMMANRAAMLCNADSTGVIFGKSCDLANGGPWSGRHKEFTDDYKKKLDSECSENDTQKEPSMHNQLLEMLNSDNEVNAEAAMLILQNGDYPGHPFHGNQYVSAGSGNSAKDASKNAREKSKATAGLKKGTQEYDDAHAKAANSHRAAAKLQRDAGNDAKADEHEAMQKFHEARMGSTHGEKTDAAKHFKLGNRMKNELSNLLNIAPDADDSVFVSGVRHLVNRVAEHDRAETKAKIEGALKEFSGVIQNREQVEAALAKDFDGTIGLLKSLNLTVKSGNLPNRDNVKLPQNFSNSATDSVDALLKAQHDEITMIRNRDKCDGKTAFATAMATKPHLFTNAQE